MTLCAFKAAWLVGFALVTARAGPGTGELYSLFVDRGHRRQGVGSALLTAAEGHCRDLGS